jgi:hypothetical protein
MGRAGRRRKTREQATVFTVKRTPFFNAEVLTRSAIENKLHGAAAAHRTGNDVLRYQFVKTCENHRNWNQACTYPSRDD